MSQEVWSGPCAGCGAPITVPYLDDFICDECAAALDGDDDEV